MLEAGDVLVLPGNPRNLSSLILLVRGKFNGATIVWWGHYWSSTSRRWRQVLRSLVMAFADVILFGIPPFRTGAISRAHHVSSPVKRTV